MSRATPSKEALADWIEVRLLFSEATAISKAELLDWLDEEASAPDLDVYDALGPDEELADEDEASLRRGLRRAGAEGVTTEGLFAEEALSELEFRHLLVGQDYPIHTERGLARTKTQSWQEWPVYAFLVALNARLRFDLDANLHTGARLFERLVVSALRTFWGGDAVHFGWPRTERDSFGDAVDRLCRRIRERLTLNPSQVPARIKDLEVDVVAWRRMDDRPGQTIMLAQCAIGQEWEAKGIQVGPWRQIIAFPVEPMRGLAFPFVPEAIRNFDDFEWELLCARCGVPFDRLRLAQLISRDQLEDELVAGILEWTRDLVPALAEVSL